MDLILVNGKLHTQDERFTGTTALAARDGRIVAVGRDEEMLALRGTATMVIDVEGHRVLPGLTDSHIHFYEWALLLRGLRLEETRSLAEIRTLVQEAANDAEAGTWIVGQGWNQDSWEQPRTPTKADLDDIAPENPVILWRKDLHLAWVNSAALAAAGIDANTPDPEMGVIQHGEDGEPNGLLNELAINLVREVMPQVPDDVLDAAMKQTMARLHRLGITGVHDFRIMGGEDGPPALRAWQRLRAAGDLKLRAFVLLPGELLDQAVDLGLRSGFGDDFLRIGGIKLFSDGALGPRTAWMLDRFDDVDSVGMPLTPMKVMAEKIAKADAAGIATTIHAIGDRAIRELLDVYTEVLGKNGGGGKPRTPHRIEHMQHSHPDDLKRLAPLDLVASVQPLHLTEDMLMVEDALGERARWTYAFRDLLDAGTVLALGSDCPVVSPNPFLGIQAAVTRQRDDGYPDGGWNPSQRLSVAEAVWGYTMGAAIASGTEAMQGSLSPGKLADVIVLEEDIFEIDPLEIGKTRVKMTIFDGEVVYRAG